MKSAVIFSFYCDYIFQNKVYTLIKDSKKLIFIYSVCKMFVAAVCSVEKIKLKLRNFVRNFVRNLSHLL